MVHYTPTDMLLSRSPPRTCSRTPCTSPSSTPGAGYRQPKPDSGKGGSNQTDIYVDNARARPLRLLHHRRRHPAARPGPLRRPGLLRGRQRLRRRSRSNTPLENLQVTLAHEYFHAMQFAYDYYEDRWLLEATAAWVEDEAYDGVNDNVQYLADSPITDTGRSMDLFGGGYHYGVWIFFRYLSETVPAGEGGAAADRARHLEGGRQLEGRQARTGTPPRPSTRSSVTAGTRSCRSTRPSRPSPTPPAAPGGVRGGHGQRATREKTLAGGAQLGTGASKTFTADARPPDEQHVPVPPPAAESSDLAVGGGGPVAGDRHPGRGNGLEDQRPGQAEVRRRSTAGRGSVTGRLQAGRVQAVEVTLVNASTGTPSASHRRSTRRSPAVAGRSTQLVGSVTGKVVEPLRPPTDSSARPATIG